MLLIDAHGFRGAQEECDRGAYRLDIVWILVLRCV